MPGFLLHVGATVTCMHSGQAQPMAVLPSAARVTVGGQPVVVQPTPYAVAGCSYPPQAGGPCVTAQWLKSAIRIKAGGLPILLKDSTATCTPTGTGLNILNTQIRVKGQ